MASDLVPHPYDVRRAAPPSIGPSNLTQLWYATMNLAPDIECSLHQATLKVRSDGTSSIRCFISLRGNRLFTLEDGENMKPISANRGLPSILSQQSTASTNPVKFTAQRNSSQSSDRVSEVDSLSSQLEALSDIDKEDSLCLPGRQGRLATTTDASSNTCRLPAGKRATRKRQEVVDDWLSVGKDAFKYGMLDKSMWPPSNSRPDSLTAPSLCITDACLEPQIVAATQGPMVLAVAIHSLCSFEMEFNSDGKVSSMYLNYLN